MADFINTADLIGDYEMCDRFIQRTMTEYRENRITRIGRFAFNRCLKLTVVDVPNVTLVDEESFAECTSLEALILRSNTVATLSHYNVFDNSSVSNGAGYIYVPSALVDTYKAATNWSNHAAQIRAIEDYPNITGG
jgi:hypothetical protein